MEQYKQYLESKGYTKESIESMIKPVEYFFNWLKEENIEEENTSYTDILAYIKYCTAQGNKKITINHKLRQVERYYNYLIEIEQAETNPVKRTRVRGEKRRILHDIFTQEELENIYNGYTNTNVTGKRNKIILGLMIYQGLRASELARIEPKEIDLRQGKIVVPGSKRTAERELKLESHQVMDIQEYITETRKVLMIISGKETAKLFMGSGGGKKFGNVLSKLMKQLINQDPRIKDLEQLRASVIVNWLKHHNLRKVQYMAGHRYVSSTEKYQLNNLDDLKDDIKKFHPINQIK